MSCNVKEIVEKVIEQVSINIKTSSKNVSGKMLDTDLLNKYVRLKLQEHRSSTINSRIDKMLSTLSESERNKQVSAEKKYVSLDRNSRNNIVNSLVLSDSASKYTGKEKAKAAISTQAIAEGVAGSTANTIASLYSDVLALNTGLYTKDDIVFVSSNGNRKNRIKPANRLKKKSGDRLAGEIQKTLKKGSYSNIAKVVKARGTIVVDSDRHLGLDKIKDKESFNYSKYGKTSKRKANFNRGEWDIDEWMTKFADGYMKINAKVNEEEIGLWVHVATHTADINNILKNRDVSIDNIITQNQVIADTKSALAGYKNLIPKTFTNVYKTSMSESLYQVVSSFITMEGASLGEYHNGVVSVIDFDHTAHRLSSLTPSVLKKTIESAINARVAKIINLKNKYKSDKDYMKTLDSELNNIKDISKKIKAISGDNDLNNLRKDLASVAKHLHSSSKFNGALLHEVSHGLFTDFLHKNKDDKHVKMLIELFHEAVEKHGKQTDIINSSNANVSHFDVYWKDSLDEFVSEITSKPDLLRDLNNIKSSNGSGSIGKRFFNIINVIFQKVFKDMQPIELNTNSIASEVMIQLHEISKKTEKQNPETASELINYIASKVKEC